AEEAVTEEIGSEDDDSERRWDLESELRERLCRVVDEFLQENAIPRTSLQLAVESTLEYVRDELSDSKVAPRYYDQLKLKKGQLLPGKMRELGYHNVADLLENRPDEFNQKKEDGERYLIGMTYGEEGRQFVERFFGNPNS